MITNTTGFWRSRGRKFNRMIMLMLSPSLEMSQRLRARMVLMLPESSATARKSSSRSARKTEPSWDNKLSMDSQTTKILRAPRDKHRLKKDLQQMPVLDLLKRREMVGLTANYQLQCKTPLRPQTANMVEVPPWDKSPKEIEGSKLDKHSVCQVVALQSRNPRLPLLM